jgi:site-specific DNA recombinase
MSNDLLFFESFAKGKKVQKFTGSNCVIYTRVSTKEQADNNLSLETQRKACQQYALKSKYTIAGYFGGTFESAKTDERKQFNNMLAFVKKSKEKISYIIVYSVDRFSRSGANAIYIAEKLKREGITVFAVTQPTDTTTASGSLQQNIQFIFSEYDNQLRREKCMAGVKEQLLNGIWCTSPPTGYDIVKREGKKEFILNKKGRLIKKIYSWKLEGLSLESIKEKLLSLGWAVDARRVADMLRNPFYCGLLAHSALEGQLVEGIQEKVISKEVFLKVNGIMNTRQGGYSLQTENENVPLKRFLKCDNCSSYLTAYKAQKNQKYYYKCRTKGCNSNKRADVLHETFRVQLTSLNIMLNEDFAKVIKQQMIATYNQLNKDKQEAFVILKAQIHDIDKKLERLEERLIEEEINKQMFEKYSGKYLEEKKTIEMHLATFGNQVSNLEKSLDAVLGYAGKLNTMWDSADYMQKQKLQKLIFPEGIYYSKKKDTCRTGRVNAAFLCMSQLAGVLGGNKKGENSTETNFPALVVRAGVEPATHGFSVHCSTN